MLFPFTLPWPHKWSHLSSSLRSPNNKLNVFQREARTTQNPRTQFFPLTLSSASWSCLAAKACPSGSSDHSLCFTRLMWYWPNLPLLPVSFPLCLSSCLPICSHLIQIEDSKSSNSPITSPPLLMPLFPNLIVNHETCVFLSVCRYTYITWRKIVVDNFFIFSA